MTRQREESHGVQNNILRYIGSKGRCAKIQYERWFITLKVKPSVKKICEKCKIIKRHGHVMVICENPKHKQRQG